MADLLLVFSLYRIRSGGHSNDSPPLLPDYDCIPSERDNCSFRIRHYTPSDYPLLCCRAGHDASDTCWSARDA